MKKGKYGWSLFYIEDKWIRVYYDKTLKGKYKFYILDRFGIYPYPYIAENIRSIDRKNYNNWLKETYGYSLKDFPDYELHHTFDGILMLVPYNIHRISHCGGVLLW